MASSRRLWCSVASSSCTLRPTSFSWENRSGPAIRIDEDSRRWSTKQSKCIKSTSATPTVRNNHGEKTAPNHRLQTHYLGPSTLAQVHQFSNHRPDCLHRINGRKIPDKMTRAWHLKLELLQVMAFPLFQKQAWKSFSELWSRIKTIHKYT